MWLVRAEVILDFAKPFYILIYFVVVEPDEVSKYADMVSRDKLIFTTVLPLDMRFLVKGLMGLGIFVGNIP